MSAPFPEDLVAAPTGGSVAWRMDARGSRNIWVASPPDYKGRQITSFTADDGQDIGQGVRQIRGWKLRRFFFGLII